MTENDKKLYLEALDAGYNWARLYDIMASMETIEGKNKVWHLIKRRYHEEEY